MTSGPLAAPRAPNTEYAYRLALERHQEDAGQTGPFQTTRDDVKRTLARWSGNTQYRQHSVLISFYDWAMEEGLRETNPARQVRRTRLQRPSVYRLSRAEVVALLGAADRAGGAKRRLIYFGLLTGGRVHELAALQGRHLQRPGWVWFSKDIAKGGRERWVPVLDQLAPIIDEVMSDATPDTFVIERPERNYAQWPEPISRTTLNKWLRDVARDADIAASLHMHLLRHAFGDHIARHADLRVAQSLMGHASVETTASIYTSRPDMDELAARVLDLGYR